MYQAGNQVEQEMLNVASSVGRQFVRDGLIKPDALVIARREYGYDVDYAVLNNIPLLPDEPVRHWTDRIGLGIAPAYVEVQQKENGIRATFDKSLRPALFDKWYLGTTGHVLEHYLGEAMGLALIYHQELKKGQTTFDINEARDFAIAKLNEAIEEQVPVSSGITYEHLRKMTEIAQGNWSNRETIKAIYRTYNKLLEPVTGEHFEPFEKAA